MQFYRPRTVGDSTLGLEELRRMFPPSITDVNSSCSFRLSSALDATSAEIKPVFVIPQSAFVEEAKAIHVFASYVIELVV
jgi:hypothetical protein